MPTYTIEVKWNFEYGGAMYTSAIETVVANSESEAINKVLDQKRRTVNVKTPSGYIEDARAVVIKVN